MQKIWMSSDKKLLLTNTAVTSLLLGTSDTLQQWISGDHSSNQNKPFNFERTSMLTFYLFYKIKSLFPIFEILIFANNFTIKHQHRITRTY